MVNLIAILTLLFMSYPAYANLSNSPCLAPGVPVTALTQANREYGAANGRTYDGRGETFTGSGAGVINPKGGSDHCLVGPRIEGPISDSTAWSSSTKPDGIQHSNSTGPYRVHGLWMERVNDGLSPPKDPDTPRSVVVEYRHVYARKVRDDALENDAALGGVLRDSLFDGVHMGFSTRPGGDGWTKSNVLRPTFLIDGVMLRLVCQKDTRDKASRSSCPSGESHAKFFKEGKARFKDGEGVRYVLRNVILRADHRPIQGPSGLDIPMDAVIDNVTVIYLGPQADRLPAYPAGVRVITDATEGNRVWNEARSKWLADHGCDANGNACTFQVDGEPLPEPEPDPDPEPDPEPEPCPCTDEQAEVDRLMIELDALEDDLVNQVAENNALLEVLRQVEELAREALE